MFNVIGLLKKLLPAEAEKPASEEGQNPQFITCPNLEREAIVTYTIAPRRAGQVEYQGSYWTARCHQNITLEPGEIVYVVDRQNVTTLYVEPDPFSTQIHDLRDTAITDPAAMQSLCQAMTTINKKPQS